LTIAGAGIVLLSDTSDFVDRHTFHVDGGATPTDTGSPSVTAPGRCRLWEASAIGSMRPVPDIRLARNSPRQRPVSKYSRHRATATQRSFFSNAVAHGLAALVAELDLLGAAERVGPVGAGDVDATPRRRGRPARTSVVVRRVELHALVVSPSQGAFSFCDLHGWSCKDACCTWRRRLFRRGLRCKRWYRQTCWSCAAAWPTRTECARQPEAFAHRSLLRANSSRISATNFSKLPDSRRTTSSIGSLVSTLTLSE
jgi:hypothetical protein